MAKGRKPTNKPPARLRYEEANPVVALRLPQQTHDRFKADLAALGQSAAAWMKEHLDRDDARALALAEKLARERDGLGQRLQTLLKQVAEAEKELAERERKKVERRKEIEASVESERATILDQAKKQADALMKEQRFWLSFGAGNVAKYQAQVKEAEARLQEVNRQVEEGRAVARQIQEQQQAMLASLADKAVELARQRGVAAVACLNCLGYRIVQSMMYGVMQIASQQQSQGGQAARSSGSVAPGSAKWWTAAGR